MRAVLRWCALAVAFATFPGAASPDTNGAHPSYRNEWWRLFGHVQTSGGRSFSYEVTFFRFGVAAGRGVVEFVPATVAVTDDRRSTFAYAERAGRGDEATARAASSSLDVRVDDWSLAQTERAGTFRSRAGDTRVAIDLTQVPTRGRVTNGTEALLRVDTCAACVLHSTSYTRLRTSGSLRVNGASFAVTGTSWLDHEYGNAVLGEGLAGWDRFSIHLEDGADVMLFLPRARRVRLGTAEGTAAASGMVVPRSGPPVRLARGDFSVTVRGGTTWRSDRSGVTYPALWDVVVPSLGLDVSIQPVVPSQEIVPATVGGSPFWSGAAEVRDKASGGTTVGWANVELLGYGRPLSL
ncbi:MAG TPA: lipocalin-like domain-containing protein [Candidatus Elarobacter sp.]